MKRTAVAVLKIIPVILFLFGAGMGLEAQSAAGLFEKERGLFGLSLCNSFLFWLPPLAWNVAFASKLPSVYSSGSAPGWLLKTENILRLTTIAYPIFLPIDAAHALFMPGLAVYSVGLALYFSAWTIIMLLPESRIANTAFLKLAPAFTPLIWLMGMAIMSKSSLYPLLAMGFIGTHTAEYLFRFNIIDISY